jgi:hypothetical protein
MAVLGVRSMARRLNYSDRGKAADDIATDDFICDATESQDGAASDWSVSSVTCRRFARDAIVVTNSAGSIGFAR